MLSPFVITGCGRSGTLFTARLLTLMGVRTSHEEYFTAFSTPRCEMQFAQWLSWTDTEGEVSSLAAPRASVLSQMCGTDPSLLVRWPIHLVHLVRNPVCVIRSLMGLGTFAQTKWLLPNIKFFFRHLLQASFDDAPIVLCMKYWLYWNRLIPATNNLAGRVRIETITEPGVWRALLKMIGHEAGDDLTEAMERLGTKHHGGARDDSVTWDALPAGALKDQIMADALIYGYAEEEVRNA